MRDVTKDLAAALKREMIETVIQHENEIDLKITET